MSYLVLISDQLNDHPKAIFMKSGIQIDFW